MNRIVTRSLALTLFALVVVPVFAQRPQPFGGGFGPMGIAQLVNNKSVQEELKLTEDQKARFKAASEGVMAKYKDDLDKLRESKDFTRMGDIMKSMGEESTKVFTKLGDEILKPEQLKRLKQIELQQAGPRALASNADVQKKLKLSESQIGEIKAINDDAQKDIQEVRKGGRGADPQKRMEIEKKVAEINQDASERSMSKLTSEQKKEWIDMTGPKFELKMPMRRDQ